MKKTHRHLDVHKHDVHGWGFDSLAVLQPTTVADLFLPATALLQNRKCFETLVRDGDGAFRSLQLLLQHALVDQVVFDEEHVDALAWL